MAREVNEQEFRLVDKVTAGLKTIGEGLKGLKNNATEFNQSLEIAGKGFNAVVGAAKGIGDAVSSVAKFEETMARVGQVTKATAAEQVALQQAVRDAASTVGATSEEASQALLALAGDGLSAQQSIDALGTVLAFARGNAESAATAAEGLNQVLGKFGEPAEKITTLADSLSAVAREAGTSTKALQEGLAGAGVAAEQAGIPLDAVVAALGQLATREVESTRAGKQLTTLFEDLADPASKAAEALAAVGLQGASFSTIVQRLSTDSAAASTVLASLGDKPRAALKILLEQGGGSLTKFNTIVAQSAGASEKAAAAIDDTFNGALRRLGAQFDAVKTQLLQPILKPLADGLTELAGKLAEFANSPEFANLVTQFTAFVTDGTAQIGEFLKTFDFAEATQAVADFTQATTENLQKIADVAGVVGGAIATIYDTVKGGAAVAVEAVTGVAADVVGLAGGVSETADNLSLAFREMSSGARELSDEALADLSKRFGLTAAEAGKLERQVRAAGVAAEVAKGNFAALADALPSDGLKESIDRWTGLKKSLSEIPGPTDKAGESFAKLREEIFQAAVGAERLKLDKLAADIAGLAEIGLAGSDAYKQLTAEFAATEANINRLTEANKAAAASNKDVGDSAAAAADGLAQMGDAAEKTGTAAAGAAEGTADQADAARKAELANMALSFSLGEVNGELINQKLNAQAAGLTLDNYVKTVNGLNAQAQEQVDNLRRELEEKRELLKVDDEREKALDRLAEKYPLLRREALEPLLELDLKLIETSKAKTKAMQDEAAAADNLARANAQRAAGGGFGAPRPQQPANDDAPAPATGGGGSRESNITINVTGLVTDDAIDELSRRLARAQRLSR